MRITYVYKKKLFKIPNRGENRKICLAIRSTVKCLIKIQMKLNNDSN